MLGTREVSAAVHCRTHLFGKGARVHSPASAASSSRSAAPTPSSWAQCAASVLSVHSSLGPSLGPPRADFLSPAPNSLSAFQAASLGPAPQPSPRLAPLLLSAEPLPGTLVHRVSVQAFLPPPLLTASGVEPRASPQAPAGPGPSLVNPALSRAPLPAGLPLLALLHCDPNEGRLPCPRLWRAGGSGKQMLTTKGSAQPQVKELERC